MPSNIFSARTQRSLLRQNKFFKTPLYIRFVNKFLKSGRKSLIINKFYELQKKIGEYKKEKKTMFYKQTAFRISEKIKKLWLYLDNLCVEQNDAFFTRTWKPKPRRKFKSISTTQKKKYDERTKHRNKEVFLPTRKKKQYVNFISLLSKQIQTTKLKEEKIGKKAKYKIFIRTTLKSRLFAAINNSTKTIAKLKIKRLRKQHQINLLIRTVRRGRPRQIFVRFKKRKQRCL